MHRVCLFLFVLFLLPLSNFVSANNTFIVLVDTEWKPSVFLKHEDWYEATIQTLHSNTDDPQQNNLPITHHVYRTVCQGFSARLTQQQAAQLAIKTGILAVMKDSVCKLHTTRSPSFLGLYTDNNNNVPGRLLSMSDSGSNVTIGVLDFGIWPENRSFRDEGLGPIPSQWKGECETGQNFTKSLCNRKIIGARFFYKGYEEKVGKLNPSEDFLSARDSDGHGTHVASIAAGSAIGNASVFGYAKGTAVGVAPKARIAVYKVCWANGFCSDSDILSAFDKAVEDGVDIISMSLGGGVMSNVEPIAIGAFGAMKRGVFVSASAGNDGPRESSLGNVAPWMTTVGAGTIDRSFATDLVLGDGRVLKGTSLMYNAKPLPKNKMILRIVYGESCNSSSLDAKVVRGKIVVCDDSDPFSQEAAVESAGGVAIVIVDSGMRGQTVISFPLPLPSIYLSSIPSLRIIHDYIDHLGSNATATIVSHGTQLGFKPAPIVAGFSSRGPTSVSPFLMKPDIIAPGLNILAAYPSGLNPSDFFIMSGTSMSCPHISGVAALLKGAHPEWTPAMIRSAMMTTAYTKDKQGRQILDSNDNTNATVWAMGAGHVEPEKAADPGLVYDISPDDYLNFLCASGYSIQSIKSVTGKSCNRNDRSEPWNLNYPGIVVDFNAYHKNVIVVTRTVTHVSDKPATYNVSVFNPKGVGVVVAPVKMMFTRKGEKKSYNVTIILQRKVTVAPGELPTMDAGKIVWSEGKRDVVSPLVMVWKKDY